MLDAQEYFHLALKAGQENNNKDALEYLHKANELDPKNAQVIYLMAAQHAEIGLYDRAITGMNASLELDPTMEMAKFQLALLYTEADKIEDAKSLFDDILKNTENQALKLFSSALSSLIKGDKNEAIKSFEEAFQLPKDNPSLFSSMEHVYKNLDTKQESKKNNKNETASPAYLEAYRNSTFSEETSDD